ncbi:hypothetical protein [Streptomyces sp. NPDC051636]|uniref:hypothetical protein n=1 Tax=Streptomyces sp. NPDC051636 TaxID=3365663 RepID=UPI0037A2B39C
MKPMTGEEVRGTLWPASFPGASRARVPAHALAVLVVVTAVCGAFMRFYWADDPQVSDQYRAAALGQSMPWMLVPVAVAVVVILAPQLRAAETCAHN